MAAFDKVKSGIPEMDTALDNVRLGDNVVWRVSELSEFMMILQVNTYLSRVRREVTPNDHCKRLSLLRRHGA